MDRPATPPAMTRKQRYYMNHKDDPAWKLKQQKEKREYYLRKKDIIKEKNLKRYYDKKLQQQNMQAMAQVGSQ